MKITVCSPSGRRRVLSTFSTCLNASQPTTRGRGRRSTRGAPGLGGKCIWRTPVAQRLPRMLRHEVWERPPSLPPYRRAKRPRFLMWRLTTSGRPPMQFALPNLRAHQSGRS